MARVRLRSQMLGLGLAIVLAWPALAQWVPTPFAPEIGSRWRIAVTRTATDSIRATTRTLSYGFDLTYEAREGEGYRILYVLKDVQAEGNAPFLPVAQAAVEVLKGVEVKAVTDASGRPIRVENEAEVAAAVRAQGDRYARALGGSAQLQTLVRRVLDELASTHGIAAAQAYLAPLPLLASAQNTPLRPDEPQRSGSALPNPFGGAIKSVTLTTLGPDPRPDHYAIMETEELEETALTAAIAALKKKLEAQGGVTAEDMRANPPEIVLSVTRTQRIDVEDGMARAASMQEMTKAKFAGQDAERMRKMEVKVTRLP